jgi:putative flippase GtrA
MIHTSISSSKIKQIFRFGVTGGTAAVVEYVCFLLLIYVQVSSIVANIISFALSLLVGFTLHKLWVFKARGRTRRQLTKYLLLAGINVAISSTLIWLAVDVLAYAPWIVKLCTMVLIAASNYLVFSRFIFQTPDSNDNVKD